MGGGGMGGGRIGGGGFSGGGRGGSGSMGGGMGGGIGGGSGGSCIIGGGGSGGGGRTSGGVSSSHSYSSSSQSQSCRGGGESQGENSFMGTACPVPFLLIDPLCQHPLLRANSSKDKKALLESARSTFMTTSFVSVCEGLVLVKIQFQFWFAFEDNITMSRS